MIHIPGGEELLFRSILLSFNLRTLYTDGI